MTRVYLIRHGEAEGNIYRRAQGQFESALTAKGLRQVDALAERFRGERIDALYSSDLKRTRQTAAAVTKYHDIPMHLDPRLREVALGCWEDVPFGDLQHNSPQQMVYFNNDPARWSVPGSEPFDALTRRICGAVADIAAHHDGETVAVVSHGMAIRALLADTLGAPSAEISRVPHGDTTCVSLLAVEGARITPVWSNTADHLPAALSTFARQSWWEAPAAEDPNNVWFRRLDPKQYPQTYLAYYEKTWRAVHGDLRGFCAPLSLAAAERHARACPDAIVTIVRPDGTAVGVTELDTERGADEGAGWICLCFVEEAYRRRQLGVQLIGHAVSLFRRLGRSALRLSVFSGNTGAIRFYEEYGFRRIGESDGVAGPLYLMEKEL